MALLAPGFFAVENSPTVEGGLNLPADLQQILPTLELQSSPESALDSSNVGSILSVVNRKYEQDLESDYHRFMVYLRSKERKSLDRYLLDLLQNRSLDYLFDLWGTVEALLDNWTASTETLGKLVRFLMQDRPEDEKTQDTKHRPNDDLKKMNSKNIVSKLKKSVKPFIKNIWGQNKPQLKTSESFRRDLTRNVIKEFKQADHGFCLIVHRLEASQKPHTNSIVQLLWNSKNRHTYKSMTEELDYLRECLGTKCLVSLFCTLCLLDPDLLAKETECSLDLACGALAFYLNQGATLQGMRDPHLMLTSTVLGKVYPFRFPDVSPGCATWS